MKSLTGRISSARGWALLLTMFLGAGLMIAACGDEEAPAPTVPTPAPTPTPPPPPPEPEPEPPAVPTGLRVAETGLDFIEWSWNTVEGADGYIVQFSTDEDFTDDEETPVAEGTSYRVGGLAPGMTGFLRVRAFTGEGDSRLLSDWSVHRTGTSALPPPPMPPAAPTGLMVSDTGEDFIEWSWQPVEGADGYIVQFSTDEDFTDYREAPVAEGTSYRVGGLAPGMTGFLRVRAFTGEGDSRLLGDWSSHRTGTSDELPPPMPPAAPTGLMVSDKGLDFIEWSWQPVEGADGYIVQFSTDEDFTDDEETPVAEGTSYRVGGLDPGMTGFLRVRAFTGEGDSRLLGDWSSHRTGTSAPPPAPMPPAAPTGLMVSDTGEDFIEWSWQPVEGADGYIVQFSTDEDFTDYREAPVAEGTSYRVRNLAPGTTGYLRVRAFTGEGDSRLLSGWSIHRTGISDEPPPPMPPAAPTGLTVSSETGADFIEWSWTAVEGADGYQVQFSTNEDFTDHQEALVTEGTSHRVGDLAPGTTGYLRVRAFTDEGDSRLFSDWSTTGTGMTLATPPAAPTGLMVTNIGEDFLEWSWTAVEDADGYIVQFSTDEDFTDDEETLVARGTSHRVEGLDPGTTAYLRVLAFTGEGASQLRSPWSLHRTGMTTPAPLEPPAAPTGLEVSDQGVDFIEWSWRPIQGVGGYQVQFSANEAFTDEDEFINRTAEQITYRRTGLDAEANAYLRVRAYVGEGDRRVWSPWSTHVTGMTTAPEPELPATPANLEVQSTGSDYIVWTWDRVAGASGYEAQFSPQAVFTDSDEKFVITGIASTTYRVSNLSSSTHGYLRVRAWSGTISAPLNGEWTEPVGGTTKAPPPPEPLSRPENVRSTGGGNEDSITLAWDEVTNADHYLVRQRLATATAWSNARCDGGDHRVEDNSCVAGGLAEGQTYDFSVRAVPDSSDSTRVASEWSAEIEASTRGELRPTNPGGSGELNVRWSSRGTNITFQWDRVSLDTEYQSYTLTTYNPSSTPCPGVNSGLWTDETNPVSTSKVIPAGGLATVRGLCVRTKDKTKLSFAWGVSAPETPDVPATGSYTETTDQATTALRWEDLTVVEDFSFTTRLVERRRASIHAPAVVKAACDDGRFLKQRTAHITLPGQVESVTSGLRPYMEYILCMKYANDAGETEWAVPPETGTGVNATITTIATVPAKPPSPRRIEAKATSTASTIATVWELPTDGRNDVPRKEDGYNAKTITYYVYSIGSTTDARPTNTTRTTTPRESDCSRTAQRPGITGDWVVSGIGSGITATNTLDGIDFKVETSRGDDIASNDRNVNAKNVHLCVQGTLGSRTGPWVMSGPVTVLREPS